MRRLHLLPSILFGASLAAAGCTVEPAAIPSFAIQTGQIASFTAGQNGGYYLMYHGTDPASGRGDWEIEWTCDPSLSPTCHFAGSITSLQGSTITNAVGYDCDASVTPPACTQQQIVGNASTSEIDFDQTTPGANEFMSIKFNTNPGDQVEVDARINGARQPALVFFPCTAGSGPLCSPQAVPFDLTPTAP